MELTEEQYKQVMRYVDGEMDTKEVKAFEAALMADNELLREVVSYRGIRSLGESVTLKVSTAAQRTPQQESKHEDTLKMLQQARAHWEQRHEQDERREQDLTVIKGTNRPLPRVMNEEEGKIKRIKSLKWLAAAVTIGFVCVVALWWYMQREREDLRLAENPKKTFPEVVVNGKKPDTPGAGADSASSTVKSSAAVPPSPPGIALQDTRVKKGGERTIGERQLCTRQPASSIF